MKRDNDQIVVLRRLRSEGQISDEEFEDLAGGLVSPGPVGSPTSDPVDEPGYATPDVDTVDAASADETVTDETGSADGTALEDGATSMDQLFPPRLRQNLSANFVGGLAIAGLVLIVVSSMGILSWLVTVPAIVLMATTLLDGWKVVSTIGVLVWGLLLLVALAISVAGKSQPEPVVTATLPPQDAHPPIPGSLGIYMDQLSDQWNTVDAPPQITKGLTRYNEIGEYDTFIYRFGEWGRVAGAFDPET